MPKKDKGFSKLNHEAIELNTFHESESDDEVGMRVGTPSFDCATCGLTKSRWSIVMTVVVASLLVSCLFLFLYFAYRDSQLTNRLNELEDRLGESSSSSSSSHGQASEVSDLAAKIDELAKRLNDTTNMLLQTMGQVNDDCRAVVINQTEFVVNKTKNLNAALKEVKATQSEIQENKHTMAGFMGTFEKLDKGISELTKSHGDLQETVDKLKGNMEQTSTNVATLKAELKGLEMTAQNHTDEITNITSYCHQHVDLLHDQLGSVNVSMTTEMLSMATNMSSMETELLSMNTQMSLMSSQMSFMWRNMSLDGSISTNATDRLLDTVVPLLTDPLFMSNLTSAITAMVENFNWSAILPLIQPLLNMSTPQENSEDISVFNSNLTELWEQVGLLKDGLLQVNNSLEELTSHLHVGFLPTPSPTESTNNTEITPSPSHKANSTSSETAAQTVSVEETITNDISSAGNTTMSSSIPATVVSIPSPSTHVAPLPRPNASVVVTVSSAIGVEIVLTSSLSAVVTPVVVANKTANLIKGISALEDFLINKFDLLDKDDDNQLTVNESGFSQSLFDMLDSNKDTFITPEEIQQQIAYLQIKLDTLQLSTTDTGSTNKTSNISEVSTIKTEPLTTEATPTVLSTNESQPLTEATPTVLATSESQPLTEAVPSASETVVITSSPGLNSTSLTVSPTSTTSSSSTISSSSVTPTQSSIIDLEADLQEFFA